MDERFLEDDAQVEEQQQQQDEEQVEDEHKKQFKILEEVLGKKISSNTNSNAEERLY